MYRFDSEGRFLLKYGGCGQGPGEFESLNTFAVLANGQVVVFGMGKRLLFEAGGCLQEETFTNKNDYFATTIGDLLLVYSFQRMSHAKIMVTALDGELRELHQFHPYEPLMKCMPFVRLGGLSASRGQLIVNNLSDFGLTVYTPDGQRVITVAFPNLNGETAHLGGVPSFL